MSGDGSRVVGWWGRTDRDYSRNRVTRQAMHSLGYTLTDFAPNFSGFAADVEARVKRYPKPDLLWVPCFRQRDVLAAARFACRYHIPLVFDPLISAYDKQVYEREKYPEASRQAQRLLAWERRCFAAPDLIVADTQAHADYFHNQLHVPNFKLAVIPVGAEQGIFEPTPFTPKQPGERLQALFYGSFIHLQGPDVIVQAAEHCSNIDFHLLGDGPLRPHCESLAQNLSNVYFEDRIPYDQLPKRIAQADILLGVFSGSAKAGRVIPNKVYQALACARPVVTRTPLPGAYPDSLTAAATEPTGLLYTEPGSAQSLAETLAKRAQALDTLPQLARNARQSFEKAFSPKAIEAAVLQALNLVKDHQIH